MHHLCPVVGKILDGNRSDSHPREVQNLQALEGHRARCRIAIGNPCGDSRPCGCLVAKYLVVVLADKWRASPGGDRTLAEFDIRARVGQRPVQIGVVYFCPEISRMQLGVLQDVFHVVAGCQDYAIRDGPLEQLRLRLRKEEFPNVPIHSLYVLLTLLALRSQFGKVPRVPISRPHEVGCHSLLIHPTHQS